MTSGSGRPASAQLAASASRYPASVGPEVRVDRGRRRALVLAELGRDLVRGDDARPGQAAPQLLGDLALVARVAEREEEADGDGLGVDLGQRLEVERPQHALRPDPLVDSKAALQRNERLGMVLAEPVQVRPRLPAQVEQVLEPVGRDEGRARALALEQRVRGDGRPVREALEARRRRPRGRRRAPTPPGAPRSATFAVVIAAVLDEDGVREGAADVDAENAHAAKTDSYERTVTTRYPLELGLAVCVPRKNERKRQRPSVGGRNESRETPSEPVRRFTRLEKTQPSSGRKRSMYMLTWPAAAGVT